MSELKTLMTLLIEDKPIPPEYKDHPLQGDWNHHRDSHIEPDWLLIYKVDGDDLYSFERAHMLIFFRHLLLS